MIEQMNEQMKVQSQLTINDDQLVKMVLETLQKGLTEKVITLDDAEKIKNAAGDLKHIPHGALKELFKDKLLIINHKLENEIALEMLRKQGVTAKDILEKIVDLREAMQILVRNNIASSNDERFEKINNAENKLKRIQSGSPCSETELDKAPQQDSVDSTLLNNDAAVQDHGGSAGNNGSAVVHNQSNETQTISTEKPISRKNSYSQIMTTVPVVNPNNDVGNTYKKNNFDNLNKEAEPVLNVSLKEESIGARWLKELGNFLLDCMESFKLLMEGVPNTESYNPMPSLTRVFG